MPRDTVVLQVFVASPSDVLDERALLETVVAQLNQVWSTSLGITFEILKWETHVRPSFSSDPQAAINEQIDPDYDVFIGVFWGRIGTPTPRASSGTLEEFDRAYSRFKQSNNSPEIMLYFKDAPISPSKIDISQLQSVQDFRKSLSDKGGLYSVFEDQAGFESSLRAHLSAIAQKFVAQRKAAVSVVRSDGPKIMQSESDFSDEDDYGYIDYIEIYESRQAEMTSALLVINEATIRVGEQLNQKTKDLQSETPNDTKAARRFIKRVADDMNSYAEIVRNQVVQMTASRIGAFSALSNALALKGDFEDQEEEDLHSFRETLSSLIESTVTAKTGMTGMRASANSLPRISKELNKAKRAVVIQLDSFLSEIDNTSSTVSNIIDAIDRMISSEELA